MRRRERAERRRGGKPAAAPDSNATVAARRVDSAVAGGGGGGASSCAAPPSKGFPANSQQVVTHDLCVNISESLLLSLLLSSVRTNGCRRTCLCPSLSGSGLSRLRCPGASVYRRLWLEARAPPL